MSSFKESLSQCITKLQDPTLVIRVQDFFGIRYRWEDDGKGKRQAEVNVTNKFWYYLFWFGTILGKYRFQAVVGSLRLEILQVMSCSTPR